MFIREQIIPVAERSFEGNQASGRSAQHNRRVLGLDQEPAAIRSYLILNLRSMNDRPLLEAPTDDFQRSLRPYITTAWGTGA